MSGKSLAKAFAIGLVVYVGLNFGLYMLYLLTAGTIQSYFVDVTIGTIFDTLFGPITQPPSTFIGFIGTFMALHDASLLVRALSAILPGIIAAVVSTRFNETRYETFGAWFLIAIVSFVMAMIGSILGETSITLESIIIVIFVLLVNMAFYGFFACVSSKNDIY